VFLIEMKEETKNEVDLLLRRLGRRPDVSAAASDLRMDGEHLDADELSAYAENALPASARARYTEHLAECSSCRGLVVQLSSSVGAVSVKETFKTPAPSGLRKFLASLFSPMVLRYAAPALGLIVVAVIGVVVLRRGGEAEFVTHLRKESPSMTTVPQQTETVPNQGVQSPHVTSAEKQTSTSRPNEQAQNKEQNVPNAAPVAGYADVPSEATAKKPETKVFASEPAPPQPTPKLATATADSRRNIDAEARKQEVQGRIEPPKDAAKSRDELKREDRQTAEISASRAPAAGRGRAAEVAGAAAPSTGTVQREGAEEKEKDDSETRTVAGRRFRKQRGVWIDTAYDNSRDTMNLARGSEQYRILIADEPEIKKIADQLGGEIIVVWKGRAYHIR
jgi:Putative zinc-finger